jgi:hypothetical protein
MKGRILFCYDRKKTSHRAGAILGLVSPREALQIQTGEQKLRYIQVKLFVFLQNSFAKKKKGAISDGLNTNLYPQEKDNI